MNMEYREYKIFYTIPFYNITMGYLKISFIESYRASPREYNCYISKIEVVL